MKITNGYYLSNPLHYEDWIGGNKVEGTLFIGYFFIDENRLMSYGKSIKLNNNSESVIFTKEEFIKNNTIGFYEEKSNFLTITFDAGTIFEVTIDFTVVSSESIKNKHDLYIYKPWLTV